MSGAAAGERGAVADFEAAERGRRARLMRLTAWAGMAAALVASWQVLSISVGHAAVVAVSVVSPAMWALSLVKRDRLEAAGRVVVLVYALAGLLNLWFVGIDPPRLGTLLVGIVVIGYVVSAREAVLYSAAMLAALAAVGLVRPEGLWPETGAGEAWRSVVRQLTLVTVVMVAFHRGYRALVATLTERETAARAALVELEAARARLEAEVAARSRALEGANQDLALLGASLSHDLRAPLRQMRQCVQAAMAAGGGDRASLGEMLVELDGLAARAKELLGERQERAS